MPVYLDYAAATPVSPEVMAAMQPFFTERFFNPSALYGPATETARALDTARANIAGVLGAKPTEIIFTAGGTEANNLAVHGVMAQYPKAAVACSAIEHDSVRAPASLYKSAEIPVNPQGLVEAKALSVADDTVLVSVMYANNEIGTVQPIKQIAARLAEICRQRAKAGNSLPLYFHVDAAQAGNYLDMHVHRLGVDLLTINGGKLYGPKQSGALYVRSGVTLAPLLQGGGQERNLRSGTENVAGAVGLAAALTQSAQLRHDETARLRQLQHYFMHQLIQRLPGAVINGSRKHRLPNNVHVTLPGADNERVLMALDMHEIYAAAGSACSASHDEPSHVLAALGLAEAAARSSLRFSMGRQTTLAEIDQVLDELATIV